MSLVENKSIVRVAVTQHEPRKLQQLAPNLSLSLKPGYLGIQHGFGGQDRPVDFDLGVRYVQNSLKIESSEMKRICDAAAVNKISVSLGFSERDGDSVYISQALIDENGEIRMKRRKVKPTHMERTIYGDGSGDSLASVIKLPGVGRHEQIHVPGWPPLDPFVEGSPGFWSMSAEGALNQSQTYAIESQSFALHATAVLSESGIDVMRTKGSPIMGQPLGGCSAIIGPDGRVLHKANTPEEELIIADLNLTD
ncbi:hypothetical protein TrVFT333_002549 [Trichoderma virens FT-333]|nr:hypothetical protein TrVFT333_002549 [Trichoderma virens FT-333]